MLDVGQLYATLTLNNAPFLAALAQSEAAAKAAQSSIQSSLSGGSSGNTSNWTANTQAIREQGAALASNSAEFAQNTLIIQANTDELAANTIIRAAFNRTLVEQTATNNASESSWARLTGSVNDSGNAHLRLIGPLGLVAAAIALIGVKAIEEATALETATTRIESYENATSDAVTQLNADFNRQTNSSQELREALQPVAGEVAGLAGAEDIASRNAQIMAAAQDLTIRTGGQLAENTRAEVDILRALNLTSSDAVSVEDALADAKIRLGLSTGEASGAYTLLAERLGSLNPTLADEQSIIDSTITSHARLSSTIQGVSQGIETVYNPTTKKQADAIDALGIKTRDAAGNSLPLSTVMAELAEHQHAAGDSADISTLKEIGFGNSADQVQKMFFALKQEIDKGTYEALPNHEKAEKDTQSQMDTTAQKADYLKSHLHDLGVEFGQNLVNFIYDAIKALVAFTQISANVGDFIQHKVTQLPDWLQGVAQIIGGPVGLGPNPNQSAPISRILSLLLTGPYALAGNDPVGALFGGGRAPNYQGGNPFNVPSPMDFPMGGGGLTATGTQALVSGGLSPAQLRQIALANGIAPGDVDTAVAIALRESSGNPNIGQDYASSGHYGLLQESSTIRSTYGVTNQADPAQQFAAMAKVIATRRQMGQTGFEDWQGYTLGPNGENIAGVIPSSPGTVLDIHGVPIPQAFPGAFSGTPSYPFTTPISPTGIGGAPTVPPGAQGPIPPPDTRDPAAEAKKHQTVLDNLAGDQNNIYANQIKLQDQVAQSDRSVTEQTLADDQKKIDSAKTAAALIAGTIKARTDEEQNDVEQGNDLAATLVHDQITKLQGLYNDDVENWRKANQEKQTDFLAYQAEQRNAAAAQRDFDQDVINQNKQAFQTIGTLTKQIPDEWRSAMAGTNDAINQGFERLQGLDQLRNNPLLTGAQQESLKNARTDLVQWITDQQTAYQEQKKASDDYSQGIEQSRTALIAYTKALQLEDLTFTKQVNQEKLQSELTAIEQRKIAETDSLETSAKVSQIRAAMYDQEAAAATDATTRKEDVLQASLARQTASIQSEEAKQIGDLRTQEAQKLKDYNDILLQYEEADAVSAARQAEIQANLDAAKADGLIALGRIEYLFFQQEHEGWTQERADSINSLGDYITTILPQYVQNMQTLGASWDEYGIKIKQGTSEAQTSISGLQTYFDNAVSGIQRDAADKTSILQAQTEAQGAAIRNTQAPYQQQITALQTQIDQLNIIKGEQDLQQLPLQQNLAAMQAQNQVLSDQVTLANDLVTSSSTYLSNQAQLANLAVQSDQAKLALDTLMNSIDQGGLATAKENLAVLQSQNAVLDDQVTLAQDQYQVSDQYLASQQQIAAATMLQDQATLQLAQLQFNNEQNGLAQAKEHLAVLQSQNTVLNDQVAISNDLFQASYANLAMQTQVKADAVSMATLQLQLANTVNASLQGQIAYEQAIVNQQQAQVTVLRDQLTLTEDIVKNSPEYLALQGQSQRLQVIQDELSIAGIKNDSLDREVNIVSGLQKLLIDKNTVSTIGLQTQIAQQSTVQAQLALQLATLQVQSQANASLSQQLATLQAQQNVTNDENTLLQAQNNLNQNALVEQQAQAKVQQESQQILVDQLSVISRQDASLTLRVQTLTQQDAILKDEQKVQADTFAQQQQSLLTQQAQAKVVQDQAKMNVDSLSVITQQQAQLTLQVQSLDSQTKILQDQQKIVTDTATANNQGLLAQQAIAKVQQDQLTIQEAQVQAENSAVGSANSLLQVLNAQLGVLQNQQKVAQSTLNTTQQATAAATQGTGTFGAGQPVYNAQGVLVPPSQPPAQAVPNVNLPGVWAGSIGAFAPSTTYSAQGNVITSGRYSGYTITSHIIVNVDGQLITEYMLDNLATGQTLEVNIPGRG